MHESANAVVGGFVITVIIFFLLFLAIRGLMLWYWKINDIVARLDQIVVLLKKQINPNEPATIQATTICMGCKKPVPVTEKYCNYCGFKNSKQVG